MNKTVILFLVMAALVSCRASDKGVQQESTEVSVSDEKLSATDSIQADAVSSATSKANAVSFNGTLVAPPQQYATVTLTIGGTVKSTSLIPGTYVNKGTVLATLENPEFIELQQVYIDSRAQLEYLEAEYRRQEALSKEQAASQKKFQQSKADYLSMKSREQAAAARLLLLGVDPEDLLQSGIRPYLEVKSPLSGYVGNVQMNLGKHIAAGELLCEVINKNDMLLRLVAYEKDLSGVHMGDTLQFMVNGLGDAKYSAILVSIGQQVDEVSRSLEVYARPESGEMLFRPGMYVTARIAGAKK